MNKIIDYEYFMDSMTEWEIELCMKNMHFASKNEWEQTRMIMYTNLSPYFKRGQSKTPQELFPLSTDNNETEKHTNISSEEIERLEAQAAYLENLFATQTEKQQENTHGITS